jgi:hypothetical protein
VLLTSSFSPFSSFSLFVRTAKEQRIFGGGIAVCSPDRYVLVELRGQDFGIIFCY